MTDAARLRALSAALHMSETLEMGKLAYSSKHVHPLRNMHQQLEMAKTQQEMTWNQLVRQNKTYQKKHELWLGILFASFAINDEEIKSRLSESNYRLS